MSTRRRAHAIHALAPVRPGVRPSTPCRPSRSSPRSARARSSKGIPIAADEERAPRRRPPRRRRAGAADLLVIQAAPLAASVALEIVDRAGLPVVVSSALDTSVGLAMGAHLAASVRDLDFDYRARHRLAAGGGCHSATRCSPATARSTCAASIPTLPCSTGTRRRGAHRAGGSRASSAATRCSWRTPSPSVWRVIGSTC